MLINTIRYNAEQALLDLLEQSSQSNLTWGALHFQCSVLGLHPAEEELLLTVRQLLDEKKAAIYFFHDGDIVITWSGAQKNICKTLCDRLYTHFHLTGEEALHTYFDSQAQGEELRLLCKHKAPSPLLQFRDRAPASTQTFDEPVPTAEQIAHFRKIQKARASRSRPEILVVEDQPFSCRLLCGMLDRLYKTASVENAEQALELYLHDAPDILFLDIELPGISGHQLAGILRKLDSEAFIVMVTSNNYVQDVDRARENGARGFIVKPYSKQKIFDSVEKFLYEKKPRA